MRRWHDSPAQVGHGKMQTAISYIFIALAAVLAYQTISFVSRYLKTKEYAAIWCALFGLFSALYAFGFFVLYGPPFPFAYAPLIIVISFIMMALYVKCMKMYFIPDSVALTWATNTILVIAVVYTALFFVGLSTGESIIAGQRPEQVTLPHDLLPVQFNSRYQFRIGHKICHTVVRLIALATLVYIVLAGKTWRDRTMQAGVIFSLLVLLHNALSVNWIPLAYLPLIPFMNLVEITRLEWIARRGEELELEQYQEQIASFGDGMKEHIKLKKIGQEAASFIHDASNIAFATDCKISTIKTEEKIKEDPELGKHLQAAQDNNRRLMMLLSSGRDDYLKHNEDQLLNLKTVVADAVELTSYRLLSNDVKLTVEGNSIRETRGDQIKLSQALVNLINNACDAIADLPERWVKITLRDTDDTTVISIANSGSKISQDLWDKIFRPFFSTREELGGSGLGLKICRDNLAAMDGELTLNTDSTHTQFDIVLPSDKPEKAST